MSDTDNECAATSLPVTLPEEVRQQTEPDTDTETRDRLYSELQTIIRGQNSTSEDRPRTFLSVHISSWLESASAWAFHPTTRCFTAWGGPVVKIALATLLEYEEHALSPNLVQFIRDVIAPAVFGNTTMDPMQQEIAHILVQCLVRPNAPTVCATGSEGSRKRHR